jgi:Zn-dependent protease/predicted transcriptional regulator
MRPSIHLGRIFGIQIGLHYSWFIIAFLIVFSLAEHFSAVNSQWSLGLIWATSIVTALLFFASIVAHELSHAAVANRRGMTVRSITLFALGGVANIEQESADAKSEFWMAIAGPVMSFAIGIICLGLVWVQGWGPQFGTPHSPVTAALLWLGYINIALAVFNMIPGFPMDGGRVLRALVWRGTGNLVRATRIVARIGQGIAVVFIVFGFMRFLSGAGLGGLWIAFIGWFLGEAAGASSAQVEASSALSGIFVRDLMTKNYPAVDDHVTLRVFAEDYVLRNGQRYFIVRHDDRAVGLVTAQELRNVERERWPFATIAQITRPLSDVPTVSPDTRVEQALQVMAREEVNQAPVLSNGELVGLISRGRILEYVQTQADLKAA